MQMIVMERWKMSEFIKPCVYNPRQAENRIKELEDKVSNLERIIDSQHRTIDKYQQIFKLQEAQIERLQHDSKLQDNQQKV